MKPITIITGYLGSGKTTLLNKILNQKHGRKIAVIENEFGEKNIDYEFVLHEKEKIYQMTNGCICCNVREDLVKTLNEIHQLADKFDSIVIETTGVADPGPVLHTLKQDATLRGGYEIDSIICLVDAKNFLMQVKRSPEVKKQITAANIIIINKLDLVTSEIILEIRKIIQTLNPEADMIETQNSEVLLEDVFLKYKFNLNISTSKFLVKAKHETSISSKFIEFSGEVNPQYFGIWIDLLLFQCSENLYRMKGVLNFAGDIHRVYFQCIHDYIELSKGEIWLSDEVRSNQLVVIGHELDYSLIESGFKSCVR